LFRSLSLHKVRQAPSLALILTRFQPGERHTSIAI
jgi:hypothetical protein